MGIKPPSPPNRPPKPQKPASSKPPPALRPPSMPVPVSVQVPVVSAPVVAVPVQAPSRPQSQVNKQPVKRSLHIGLDYQGTNMRLNGCELDARNMLNFARNNGYLVNTFVTYRDLKPGYDLYEVIKNFVSTIGAGDSVLISYSGHGTNRRDRSGDETDGMDEALVGYRGNLLIDDQLSALLSKVPSTSSVIFISDSCNSGSNTDTKYMYIPANGVGNYKQVSRNAPKPGNFITISGCKDSQLSLELSVNGRAAGAMTTAFLDVVKNQPYKLLTWADFVLLMRGFIKGLGIRTQEPQLCSNKVSLFDSYVNF